MRRRCRAGQTSTAGPVRLARSRIASSGDTADRAGLRRSGRRRRSARAVRRAGWRRITGGQHCGWNQQCAEDYQLGDECAAQHANRPSADRSHRTDGRRRAERDRCSGHDATTDGRSELGERTKRRVHVAHLVDRTFAGHAISDVLLDPDPVEVAGMTSNVLGQLARDPRTVRAGRPGLMLGEICLSEALAGSVSQSGDRSRPSPQQRRDLVVRTVLDSCHPQCLLPIGRQRRKRIGDQTTLGKAVGILEDDVLHVQVSGIRRDGSALARPRLAAVANACHQVLAEVVPGARTMPNRGQHGGERVVDDIVGILPRTKEVPRDASGSALVTLPQFGVRVGLVGARTNEIDQFVVGQLRHRRRTTYRCPHRPTPLSTSTEPPVLACRSSCTQIPSPERSFLLS